MVQQSVQCRDYSPLDSYDQCYRSKHTQCTSNFMSCSIIREILIYFPDLSWWVFTVYQVFFHFPLRSSLYVYEVVGRQCLCILMPYTYFLDFGSNYFEINSVSIWFILFEWWWDDHMIVTDYCSQINISRVIVIVTSRHAWHVSVGTGEGSEFLLLRPGQ